MYRVVIPARYASSRFPGKPLVNLAGRPLLAWVHDQARRSAAAEVLVATDDERIAAVAREFGATVVMTRGDHPSGTDRIAEVARERRWGAADVVVNLQGDEPLMPPRLLDDVAAALVGHPAAGMATVASPIVSLEEFRDPNVVKVVIDAGGRALYFSRAPIPWHRDGAAHDTGPKQFEGALRHIGLYAYRVAALGRLASLAPTPLENAEKLEQLRALEHGIEIRVVRAAQRPGGDVNTPQDLERVGALLRNG